MDFIDKIKQISSQIPKQMEHIHTEEATKNALVLPFIQALGYEIFNPLEVVPEYIADFGTKKGEKVDYAIMRDGSPIMLFECKPIGTTLHINHMSQLFRYFTTSHPTRFGILTNGVEYAFHSDLEKANLLDDKPFFLVNLLEITDTEIEQLKRFSKPLFDVEQILTTATELKYTRELKRIINKQLREPDDDMIRLLAGQVYSGKLTQKMKEAFAVMVKKAFQQVINETINERIQSALHETSEMKTVTVSEGTAQITQPEPEAVVAEAPPVEGRKIETTQDEIDGYYVVKAILREILPVKRICMRDAQSYFSILLDDNNRKPICRLHFNRAKKQLSLFDNNRTEETVVIESVDDIYKYADRLKATIKLYEPQNS
jgi:predicted type IV restriction endonuclease